MDIRLKWFDNVEVDFVVNNMVGLFMVDWIDDFVVFIVFVVVEIFGLIIVIC